MSDEFDYEQEVNALFLDVVGDDVPPPPPTPATVNGPEKADTPAASAAAATSDPVSFPQEVHLLLVRERALLQARKASNGKRYERAIEMSEVLEGTLDRALSDQEWLLLFSILNVQVDDVDPEAPLSESDEPQTPPTVATTTNPVIDDDKGDDAPPEPTPKETKKMRRRRRKRKRASSRKVEAHAATDPPIAQRPVVPHAAPPHPKKARVIRVLKKHTIPPTPVVPAEEQTQPQSRVVHIMTPAAVSLANMTQSQGVKRKPHTTRRPRHAPPPCVAALLQRDMPGSL